MHLRQMAEDFPWLACSRDADAALPPPAPGEGRVVFMGDSITEFWHLDSQWGFPGKPCIDRGIAGQTTPQMVLRFHQDVIALMPKAVARREPALDLAGPMHNFDHGVAILGLTPQGRYAPPANRHDWPD
jgi:hypothetical protein